jgi:hypothetical protein
MAQIFKETNSNHCGTLIPDPISGRLNKEEKTKGNPR